MAKALSTLREVSSPPKATDAQTEIPEETQQKVRFLTQTDSNRWAGLSWRLHPKTIKSVFVEFDTRKTRVH